MSFAKYLDFIRFAIGSGKSIFDIKDLDWEGLYTFSEEHAIAGVVFEGVKKMDDVRRKMEGTHQASSIEHFSMPPFDVLIEWMATAEQTMGQNRAVNNVAERLVEELEHDGYKCCILKGQGNSLMYPNPMSRTPGDIDVWMMCHTDTTETTDNISPTDIIRYVKTKNPQACAIYHHIDYGLVDGVEVEVHFRPSFMYSPIHNSRLQKWFRVNADEQFQHVVELPDGVGTIAVPTTEFNIVFQLSHIYNHLLHEGIGLRQIIDYYFLLKKNTNDTNLTGKNQELENLRNKATSKDAKKKDLPELRITLRYLGLEKIAGAMMWVLSEVLGLEEEYLIAPMDERRGKMLFAEILKGGNFGQYDKVNKMADTSLKRNWQRIKRDFRMLRYYPLECLWEPPFRLYHFFWRMKYN